MWQGSSSWSRGAGVCRNPLVVGEETKPALFFSREPATLCAELSPAAGSQRVSVKPERGQYVLGQRGVSGLQSWL